MKIRLLALSMTVLLGGCGSIVNMLTEWDIYGGVKNGVRLVEKPYLPKSDPPEYFFPLVIIGIIDIPLSAVLDTLTLPISLIVTLTKDDSPNINR